MRHLVALLIRLPFLLVWAACLMAATVSTQMAIWTENLWAATERALHLGPD